ncbi:hypothetical protein [Gayadomonas joobiniege]|uniref:hypothetical protein n=1 Tax=Gayadomonas joobiniege TaxID=1234606 RepID=UPI00035F539B|nr:hypothetical protein [Gayadomonas joobiniege]
MNKKNKWAVACLLISLSKQVMANENNSSSNWQLSTELSSFSYSEVMPVVNTFGGVIPIGRIAQESSYSDEPERGREAITHNRISFNLQHQNWLISLASRYDYDVKFTPDAAQLFFLEKEQRPVDKDIYELFFKAKHIRANGIGLGYQYQLQSLNIKVMGYLWDVQYMESGTVAGDFIVSDVDDSYDITGVIDYAYFEDALLERKNCPDSDPPVAGCHGAWDTQGQGYSFDVSLQYRLNQNWQMQIQLTDLFNQFTFDKLGRTQGQLDTRNQVFNADGTFSIKPSFSGTYPDGRYQMRMTTQLNFRLEGNLGLPVWAEMYAANDAYFPAVGIAANWANWRFESGYQWHSNSYLAAVRHDNFYLKLAADNFNLSAAKAITLNSGFSLSF